MKNLLSLLLIVCISAKAQVSTTASLSTLISTYNKQIPALLADTSAKGKTIRAQAALIATLLDSMKLVGKPNRFDTGFAKVTIGATYNTITANTWRFDDLAIKYSDLLGKYSTLLLQYDNLLTFISGTSERLNKVEAKIPKTATSTSVTTTTTTLQ